MTHEQRLQICELCTNRAFSPKLGSICSLTNERSAFVDSCSDYSEDLKMIAKRDRELEDRAYETANGTVSGTNQSISDHVGSAMERKHGMNGRIVAGVVAIVIAVLWFVLGIVLINRVFYYPIFLFGFGIYKIIDGSIKGNQKKLKENSDLLDL